MEIRLPSAPARLHADQKGPPIVLERHTWPTIAFAGRRVDEMLQSLQVGGDAGFLHHELAHYYFGSLRYARGPYFWFFIESTTEFLALKALQHFGGEAAYQERLHKYYRDLGHFDEVPPVPLDRITGKDQMDQFYRYRYGPLLLVALEQEIGSERIGDLFHQLLTAPADLNLDYQTLSRSLRSLGVPAESWQRFEERCIHPSPPPAAWPLSPTPRRPAAPTARGRTSWLRHRRHVAGLRRAAAIALAPTAGLQHWPAAGEA
jgi:hypothetical protein